MPGSLNNTLQPDWPEMPAGIGALVSLRNGGVSRTPYGDGLGGGGLNLGSHVGDDLISVQRNRQQLSSWLPAQPAWLAQVHGTVVLDAATIDTSADAPTADASFTTAHQVVCAILSADCLPVLFCDRAGGVVGAAHAGWRGLAAGVLEQTVAAMRNSGADQILAWLGPAIGPTAFEVGAEVRDIFVSIDSALASAFVAIPARNGKYLADIYQLARLRLQSAGVDKIAGGEFCTYSDTHRFYSYRRDGRTGRMASFIWLR